MAYLPLPAQNVCFNSHGWLLCVGVQSKLLLPCLKCIWGEFSHRSEPGDAEFEGKETLSCWESQSAQHPIEALMLLHPTLTLAKHVGCSC